MSEFVTKETSDAIDRFMEGSKQKGLPNLSNLPAEKQLPGFITLVQVLESALLIVQKRYHQDPPDVEPFPGAVAAVVRQSLAAIEMMRIAGCQPPRDAP